MENDNVDRRQRAYMIVVDSLEDFDAITSTPIDSDRDQIYIIVFPPWFISGLPEETKFIPVVYPALIGKSEHILNVNLTAQC